MDQVLADSLKANLKSAKNDGELLRALVLAMIAVVDCQLKTANRVKLMYEERERFRWAGRIVWGFCAGGGFSALVIVMKKFGVI